VYASGTEDLSAESQSAPCQVLPLPPSVAADSRHTSRERHRYPFLLTRPDSLRLEQIAVMAPPPPTCGNHRVSAHVYTSARVTNGTSGDIGEIVFRRSIDVHRRTITLNEWGPFLAESLRTEVTDCLMADSLMNWIWPGYTPFHPRRGRCDAGHGIGAGSRSARPGRAR